MKPIQQASEILTKAQRDINEILKDPENVNNLPGINTYFDRIKARLVFMGAVMEPELKDPKKDQFPPITNFMGEKIEVNEQAKTAELRPDEAQRKAFVERVDQLFGVIVDQNPHTILNSYTNQADITVLRGVAKRADVVDFKEAEITLAFIEEVQRAVKVKTENLAKQKEIDSKSKSTKTILTVEMIELDEDLKKMNAQPGDELEVTPNGKKKIHKAEGK